MHRLEMLLKTRWMEMHSVSSDRLKRHQITVKVTSGRHTKKGNGFNSNPIIYSAVQSIYNPIHYTQIAQIQFSN